jgi:hypothetical protein
MVLRLSLPVFVAAPGAKAAPAWSIRRTGAEAELELANRGTAHLRLRRIELRAGGKAGGDPVQVIEAPLDILPGEAQRWPLTAAAMALPGLQLQADTGLGPLDTELKTAEVAAVPFERSGVRIGFPLARTQRATAILRDATGAPLPVGLKLASDDGKVTAWVARDGFTQVEGPLVAPVTVASRPAQGVFTCTLPQADGADPLPDLGEIACR